jgi:hypothetical protein
MRSTRLRSTRLRSARLRSALLRSGGMSGFSSRHAFQADAPCLSNATCSSFAMEAAALGGGNQRRRGGSTQYEPELDQLPGQMPTFGMARGARSDVGVQ